MVALVYQRFDIILEAIIIVLENFAYRLPQS